MIHHICAAAEWEAARSGDEYRPASLATEGFVHCSPADQVLAAAARHFAGRDDLVVLAIDEAELSARVVYEDLYGAGCEFPHVYGPVPVAAVRAVHDLGWSGFRLGG